MAYKNLILSLFEKSRELSVKEIVDRLGVSKQNVHIILNRLMDEKIVEKLGRAPKTVYRLLSIRPSIIPAIEDEVDQKSRRFLEENFLIVTESGDLMDGIKAFSYWCSQRKLPLTKTIAEFVETKKKYASYYTAQGIINGMEKLRNTKGYEKIWLDELYYVDFYAIERFGKTRLGTLLHYAKQGQNKYLMDLMMREARPKISRLVALSGADAVAFVPPTIRREVQIMKFIQSDLRFPLPVIDIKKIGGIIPVPQKSLSNLGERIINAERTFAVTEQRKFKHVVLIDDAVGSGSTLNQVAGKIKEKEVAAKVTGLAIVGSFKGFDVITDV